MENEGLLTGNVKISAPDINSALEKVESARDDFSSALSERAVAIGDPGRSNTELRERLDKRYIDLDSMLGEMLDVVAAVARKHL